MHVVQLALIGLISFYFIGIIIAYANNRADSQIKHRELQSIEEEFQQTEYKFSDPDLAYKILTQLETTDEADANLGYQPRSKSSKPYLNLRNDDRYCDKRRAYFVEYPESLFEEMDFVTDRVPKSLVRNKVLMQIGHDVQPNIGAHISSSDQTLYDIKPTVSSFYTKLILFSEKRIGQHFSCLSQISNHLPGRQPLAVKDGFAENAVKYAERFEGRPQCFDFDKFFPKTFLLYQKHDCQDFFKILNSPQYQALKQEQKVVYMTKMGRGSHNSAGIELLTDKEEAELKDQYDNGHDCGRIDDKILVQKYIHNPLLIDGHKFDLNGYMLVASINPLMAYYHDGYLKVSISEYDLTSSDKKAFLSNILVSQKDGVDSEDGGLYEGMNEEELKHAQQWTYERLQEYLLKAGVVKDPNWLNNYLRPELKKAMIHLLRFGLVTPSLNSGVYQLYGVDFMLDADLNLWFIEANSAPGMDGFSQTVEKMMMKMVKDELEMEMGLLRSRMKRVIIYVNELIASGSVKQDEEDGEILIKNFETTKVRFDRINENYFEREFEPSVNGFVKIVDENMKGTQKYMGFITQECL